MNDSRLRTASALTDDARTLLADLLDELPALPASHFISQAANALNLAITNLNKAYTEPDAIETIETRPEPTDRWTQDAEAGAIG